MICRGSSEYVMIVLAARWRWARAGCCTDWTRGVVMLGDVKGLGAGCVRWLGLSEMDCRKVVVGGGRLGVRVELDGGEYGVSVWEVEMG